MSVKIVVKCQITPDGNVQRARQVDRTRLALLRGKLRRSAGRFNLESFRAKPHVRALRD